MLQLISSPEDATLSLELPPLHRPRTSSNASGLKKYQEEKEEHQKIKKNVSFADALGLDLECVVAFSPDDDDFGPAPEIKIAAAETAKNVETFLKAKFLLPPHEILNLLLVKEKVRLESIAVTAFSISGVVRVLNIHFEKEVTIRYSIDDWATSVDLHAVHIHGSTSMNESTDRFLFTLLLPYDLPLSSTCQFCIRYKTDNEEFWDNNAGNNYVLECTKMIKQEHRPKITIGWDHEISNF